MKLKSKFGALTLAVALGAGMLVGCNNNKPAPAPTPKYLVNVPTSADYRIDGIVEDKQYVAGASVSFTVEVLNADKRVAQAGYTLGTQRNPVQPVEGIYTFAMPESTVSLFVQLENIERYALTAGGTLKVDGEPVQFSLSLGTDPVASWTLTAIEGATRVSIENHTVTPLEAGDVTFAASVGGQQVATLPVTIAASEIMSIKSALDAAILEAPCNGSGGNASAKTTTDFTISGKVVYVTEYDDSGAKDVIIDDGTEAVVLIVYSSSKAAHDWALGDSVKTTCKFTNYYGLFEGISTTSTATKQNSLYPDQITKINKTFATQYTQLENMSSAQWLQYVATATANQSASAGAYTDIKLVNIDVTYDAEHNMKTDGSVKGGYVIDGTENVWALNAAEKTISSVRLDAVTGHKSTLRGFIPGVNSSYKTGKMYATDQFPLSVESVEITEGDALTVFLNNPVSLHYTTLPEGSFSDEVWTSTDQNKVSVDEHGVVTGLEESTETVRLTVGGVYDEITITVSGEQHACEGISLNKNSTTLTKGASETLVATLTPDDCTDPVVWTTSDATIATVADGVVTAASDKTGTATITATCGEFHADCEVTVKQQKIADLANAVVDDPVDVYGYITARYTVTSRSGLWVCDGNRGIFLFKKLPTGMAIGDAVHVVGKISANHGAKQVADTTFEKVTDTTGLNIQPASAVEITQSVISSISSELQGAKATVTGVVKSHSNIGSTTANHTIILTVGSEEFKVYGHKDNDGATVLTDIARATVGATVTFSGFVTANKSNVTDFTTLSKGDYQIINPTLDNVVGPTLTGIAVSPKTASVDILNGAKTKQFSVAPTPAGADLGTVTWTVSPADAGVTVDANGLVSIAANAVEEDQTANYTITASAGGFTDTATLTVSRDTGGGGVVEQTVTFAYTGSTTTNMTGGNDAALVGLDATVFSVVGEKGSASNFPGLNKDGTTRLYNLKDSADGNKITVSLLTTGTIKSITFTLGPSNAVTWSDMEVKAGSTVITGTDGAFTVNASSFSFKNVINASTGKQFHVASITIVYEA